jgi:signal peptidase I
VPDGAILWSGHITAGDHVFVNKVAWNFRRPRRGEIMVFDTNGIRGIQQNTHYIKRLAGKPRETVSIVPPYLLVDGVRVESPESIRRIAEKHEGYHGYQVAPPPTPSGAVLAHPGDRFTLGEGEYFALGDNTLNSKDGRYWGAVPQANLVGPASLIYWPLSRRWGVIR